MAPNVLAALRGFVATDATRDEPLRVEAAWILAFLTAKENETASALVGAGMVPALVEALVDSRGQVKGFVPFLVAVEGREEGRAYFLCVVGISRLPPPQYFPTVGYVEL